MQKMEYFWHNRRFNAIDQLILDGFETRLIEKNLNAT